MLHVKVCLVFAVYETPFPPALTDTLCFFQEAVVANLNEDNKHRVPWETIRAYGVRRGFFEGRRGVDLKDKWRNLKRAEEKASRS
jgi:hypothetical protein